MYFSITPDGLYLAHRANKDIAETTDEGIGLERIRGVYFGKSRKEFNLIDDDGSRYEYRSESHGDAIKWVHALREHTSRTDSATRRDQVGASATSESTPPLVPQSRFSQAKVPVSTSAASSGLPPESTPKAASASETSNLPSPTDASSSHADSAEARTSEYTSIVSSVMTSMPTGSGPLEELLGRLASLSNDQSEFCESFNLDADTAYRFLKARNFDVAQAETMFRQSLKWRKEISLQAQCKEWAAELAAGTSRAARVVRAYWFNGNYGMDRRGLPVNLIRMGRADPDGVVREIGFDAFLLQHCLQIEEGYRRARELSIEKKSLLCSFIEIYDMGGDDVPNYNYRAYSAVKHLMRLSRILEANFPERVHKVFILRIPWVFSAIWRMVEHSVPASTKEKIKVSSKGCTEELQAQIDDLNIAPWLHEHAVASSLPPCLFAGGPVPRGTAGKEGSKQTLRVSKVEKVHLDLGPGEACAWRWCVRTHDITFSVMARPCEGSHPRKAVEVVTPTRVAAMGGWQEGGFVADENATGGTRLTLTFDNSYSWTRSKTIDYVLM